jgi:FkbM family methyltransferase
MERLRLALWQYCHARRMERPIRMSWGRALQIYVYLGNDASRCLFVGGCIEPNEFAFLGGCLEPGMVFVDVGANEGIFTLFAAERVTGGGSVLAVEPSRREFERLQANLRLNALQNVRTSRLGLSNASGEGVLHVAGYPHEGHNTLGGFVYGSVTPSHTEAVVLERLDDLVEAEGFGRVDVLKLDAEGAEYAVLEGARRTLAQHRPLLLLELSDAALQRQGRSVAAILGLLREAQYDLYTFDVASGRPVPAAPGRPLSPNVVAAPRGCPWPGLQASGR